MDVAIVRIWGKEVGAVLWNPDLGRASFQYYPQFIKEGLDLSPLMMPIEDGSRIFDFPSLANSATFKGLPGLLADVLPDKYGNALINEWLARQGRPAGSMNPVEMLCYIGKRGMGALDFEPVIPKASNSATKLEISDLVTIASNILNERQEFRGKLSSKDEKALLDILKIGTSAGGARAKALIAYNENTGEVLSGQTNAPKGFRHWLMKFDGVHDSQFGEVHGYGRVEMAYYLMAIDCGIEMSECRLFEENGRAHFMTSRFDRIPGEGKIHTQSWCALTHRDFKETTLFSYEQLFETMRILNLPYFQAEELYRRMVFNVIARNCDDHSKNFSFTMNRDGVWRLSPAYDICHAYRPGSEWVSQQNLSVNGKRRNITYEDFKSVADNMNIQNSADIVGHIQEVVNKWRQYASRVNVSDQLTNGIEATLLKLV